MQVGSSMSSHTVLRLVGGLVVAAAVVLAVGLDDTAAQADAPVDQDRVEQVEDWTEDLANQLHDLSISVRDRDGAAIASHFSENLTATPWPSVDAARVPAIKWIVEVDSPWPLERADADTFLRSWHAYLDGLAHIEDVRFKVKQAHFQDSGAEVRADASIYIAIVARDRDGRRTWIEAKAHLDATHLDGTWSIGGFAFSSFHARVALTDLFSEVSLPAGVYHATPPFGSPGNPGFIAHGIAVADVDGDGLLDAFTTGQGQNFLYMNLGDGRFHNGAGAAGLAVTPNASGALFVDYDNDGDSDLFLAAPGDQMLFENRLVPDGTLGFVDVSAEAGVDLPAQGFSASAADINGDGYADIHVASYNRYGLVMPNSWSRATNGTPNLLFVNKGDGTFAEQGAAWGLADRRWSYATHFVDLDDDGRQDLYVANDFGENAVYINKADHFEDAAAAMGMLDPGNGMGVSAGDYDNDGLIDLHVTSMSSTAGNRILKRLFPDKAAQLDETRILNKLAAGNTVFRNLGEGHFEDVSARLGPFAGGWAWGGGFVDFDNDGWLDIHSPNGFVSGKSLKDT